MKTIHIPIHNGLISEYYGEKVKAIYGAIQYIEKEYRSKALSDIMQFVRESLKDNDNCILNIMHCGENTNQQLYFYNN